LVVLGSSALYVWWKNGQLQSTNGLVRLIITLCLILAAAIFYLSILGFQTIDPSEAERDIYEFVSTLPKDAILAGEPVIMSGIPLFSQRSVLFRDLHPDINPNASLYILDYFDAQYAESPQKIIDFCQRYKVTHLVLDNNDFSPQYLAQKEFFYQPWNDVIIERVQDQSNFVLPRIEPIFTSDPFVVIECTAETILAAR